MNRHSAFVSVFLLAVGIFFSLVTESIRAKPAGPSPVAAPAKFVAVDTSNLMGSPDPLPPLEIVNAFPKLEFVRPVQLTHAGDGSDRIFVVDQPGIVHVFPNKSDAEKAEVFLDVQKKAKTSHFEEGLLGLAFHPKYKENGVFFTYYSIDPRASRISRWKVSADNPNRADPSSEEEIIQIAQPFGNHNGGSIEFGPDGMLYVGLGDGGSANDPHGHGQNLKTLLGSILRIDVDKKDEGKSYAIPKDNPFVGEAGKKYGEGVRGEIWAYGIRNPWRMTFDRANGDLWVGDVGQNLWEEVDIIEKGGNYGWKVREGDHFFSEDAETTGDEFIPPIFEYTRHEGKSITGGFVYRGKKHPELGGVYFYADFATFNVWGLRYDREAKKVTSNSLIARSFMPVTGFGEDEQGEVYVTAFDAKKGDDVQKASFGQLFRLSRGSIYRFERRKGEQVDTAAFPRLLSKTNLFKDVKNMVPAPGLIPYDVNVPLWSDGAKKTRYLALPKSGQVKFNEKGAWEFPEGTVFVKTFELDGAEGGGSHRLETRLLVHSRRGWVGYTYKWKDDLSDAELLDSAAIHEYSMAQDGDKPAKQSWYFPSRSDCNACHTKTEGFVLGLNTQQMNRVHDFGGAKANQIGFLTQLEVFTEKPAKPSADLAAYPDWRDDSESVGGRARAYLDVNCSICHRPGGTGVSKADLRFETPWQRMRAIAADPGQKRFLTEGSKIIAPGEPHRSEILARMMATGPGRMPSLASSEVDWDAVRVLGEWISSMPKPKAKPKK